MKIVLVGYMGSGKTTLGKLVAEELDYPFLDLDDYIKQQLGLRINDIFSSKGEVFFRKKEHELLKELLETKKNVVLATGGGTPCYAGNMELILDHTPHVFYVNVPISELIVRLYKEREHRPLIAHLGEEEMVPFVGKHLFERNPFYSRATHIIDGNQRPEAIANTITSKLP